MTARCTVCSKSHNFRNRRGARLSDSKCECGGTLELIGGMHTLSGQHPYDESKTFRGDYIIGNYFYADRNRKGEYFVLHDGFYHQVQDPVPAVRSVRR